MNPYKKRFLDTHRIIAARKAKGLSRPDLSRLMGVDYGQVTKWEKGLASPNQANGQILADLLCLKVHELWLDNDRKVRKEVETQEENYEILKYHGPKEEEVI